MRRHFLEKRQSFEAQGKLAAALQVEPSPCFD